MQFVNRVPFYGAAILCLDEPNVQAILPDVKRPIITYGTSSQADLIISDIKLEGLGSEFRLTYKGDDLGMFNLIHPRLESTRIMNRIPTLQAGKATLNV